MSLQPRSIPKTPLLKPLARALAPLALGFLVFPVHAAVPQAERDALVALYNSTNGANWTNNSNWLTGDPCNNAWHGVTCNDTGSQVTRLDLGGNQLSGPVPAALGQLSALQSLDLSYNTWLIGTLPASLGQLSALQSLNLSYNQLSGSIPETLGQLSALQSLNLSYNYPLSGAIPETLGQLSALQSLQLAGSHLSGPIPETLGQLSALQSLDLASNQLSGPIPASLGQLSMLQSLSLGTNQLSGPIPETLGQLSGLQELDLGGNPLGGPIPEFLVQLPALRVLDLVDNQLSGPIPASLGQLSMLQRLSLNNNQLSGPIPESLGQLSALQSLRLSNNQLSGTLPESLGQLSALEYLYLDDNQLSGTLPEALGQLSTLRHLGLSSNQLSGPIPEALVRLPLLRSLYLAHNQLSGPIPDMSALSLSGLDLGYNQLTGPLPPPPTAVPGAGGLYAPVLKICPNPLDITPSVHDAAWAGITVPKWPEGCPNPPPEPGPAVPLPNSTVSVLLTYPDPSIGTSWQLDTNSHHDLQHGEQASRAVPLGSHVGATPMPNEPVALPPGYDLLPQAPNMYYLRLTSDTPADPVRVELQFDTALPENARLFKYHPTGPGSNTYEWTDITDDNRGFAVSFSADRTSLSLTLRDGGFGDNDFVANGVIVDPLAVLVPAGGEGAGGADGGSGAVAPIPTLGGWAMMLLAGLLGFLGVSRRQRA